MTDYKLDKNGRLHGPGGRYVSPDSTISNPQAETNVPATDYKLDKNGRLHGPGGRYVSPDKVSPSPGPPVKQVQKRPKYTRPYKRPGSNERKPFMQAGGNYYAIVCEVKYKQNGVTVKKYITVVQDDIKLTRGTKKAVREQAGMDYDARNVRIKAIQTIDRWEGVRVDPATGRPYN